MNRGVPLPLSIDYLSNINRKEKKMKKIFFIFFALLFLFFNTLSAHLSMLNGSGQWSNTGIWIAYPDETSTSIIFLYGNQSVTLDGNYHYPNLTHFYIGGAGNSGTLQAPGNTSATFDSGNLICIGQGNQPGDDAYIYVTGGEICFKGVDVNVNYSSNSAVETVIDVSSGTFSVENDLILNSGNNTGHKYKIKIWNNGTLKANSITDNGTGSTLSYFILDNRGSVIVSGNQTADPSLGGIITTNLGGLLDASYSASSDETTIFNRKTFYGEPIPILPQWAVIFLGFLAAVTAGWFILRR